MNGQLRKTFSQSWMKSFTSTWTHVLQKRTINAICILLENRMALIVRGGGYRVFCNPPYSEISRWVEKAYREGCKDNTIVVLLIPARTETRYFHNFILHRSEIRFLNGRLKFGDAKYNAPFPSMVVIFRGPSTEKRKKNNADKA